MPDAPAPAVAVRDLRFGYPGGGLVLDIPSLELARGEMALLHGPSGGGKTTLLGLIAGVIASPPGAVTVLDRDLGRLSAAERDRFRGAHVGYLFQLFNLIPYLTAAENIGLPCRLSAERRARLGGASPDEAVAALAERLGIAELLERPVARLSVGQQQRVAAARALIGAPELVLADEPTSALDAAHRARFLELLFARCAEAGAALLFVSHDEGLRGLFPRAIALADVDRAAAGGRPEPSGVAYADAAGPGEPRP